MKKVISVVLVLTMTLSSLVCGSCFAEENVEKSPTTNISQKVKKEEGSKWGKLKKALCVALPVLGTAVISYFAKDSIVEFFNGKSEIQDNNTDSAQMKNVNDFGVWQSEKENAQVVDKFDKSNDVTPPLEEEHINFTGVSPLKYDYGSNIIVGTLGYLNVIALSITIYFAV